MTSSEYPKTFTRESDGKSVLVSTRSDEVQAKFNGYREDVVVEDAYAVDEPPVAPTPATVRPRFGRDAS